MSDRSRRIALLSAIREGKLDPLTTNLRTLNSLVRSGMAEWVHEGVRASGLVLTDVGLARLPDVVSPAPAPAPVAMSAQAGLPLGDVAVGPSRRACQVLVGPNRAGKTIRLRELAAGAGGALIPMQPDLLSAGTRRVREAVAARFGEDATLADPDGREVPLADAPGVARKTKLECGRNVRAFEASLATTVPTSEYTSAAVRADMEAYTPDPRPGWDRRSAAIKARVVAHKAKTDQWRELVAPEGDGFACDRCGQPLAWGRERDALRAERAILERDIAELGDPPEARPQSVDMSQLQARLHVAIQAETSAESLDGVRARIAEAEARKVSWTDYERRATEALQVAQSDALEILLLRVGAYAPRGVEVAYADGRFGVAGTPHGLASGSEQAHLLLGLTLAWAETGQDVLCWDWDDGLSALDLEARTELYVLLADSGLHVVLTALTAEGFGSEWEIVQVGGAA